MRMHSNSGARRRRHCTQTRLRGPSPRPRRRLKGQIDTPMKKCWTGRTEKKKLLHVTVHRLPSNYPALVLLFYFHEPQQRGRKNRIYMKTMIFWVDQVYQYITRQSREPLQVSTRRSSRTAASHHVIFNRTNAQTGWEVFVCMWAISSVQLPQ